MDAPDLENKHGGATGTEAEVCRDIARRQVLGLAKYGATVADSPEPLPYWLRHAYEETLDQAVYLKRAIEEMEAADAPSQATATEKIACIICEWDNWTPYNLQGNGQCEWRRYEEIAGRILGELRNAQGQPHPDTEL